MYSSGNIPGNVTDSETPKDMYKNAVQNVAFAKTAKNSFF